MSKASKSKTPPSPSTTNATTATSNSQVKKTDAKLPYVGQILSASVHDRAEDHKNTEKKDTDKQ